MLFKSGTLLGSEDRAEIAAASEARQQERTGGGVCSNYVIGGQAFASPEDDKQDAAALGEHAPRQTASEQSGEAWRARAGRVNCWKRKSEGYFGRYHSRGGGLFSGREGPQIKWARARGRWGRGWI